MKNKGFTLLELLIVIIIIGLLASIGIVQYSKAIANSKNTQAKTILMEARKAALAFESINDAWPVGYPVTADLDGDGTNDVNFDPISQDFTFTFAGINGVATPGKNGPSGNGVFTWTVDLTNGQLSHN